MAQQMCVCVCVCTWMVYAECKDESPRSTHLLGHFGTLAIVGNNDAGHQGYHENG